MLRCLECSRAADVGRPELIFLGGDAQRWEQSCRWQGSNRTSPGQGRCVG